MAYAIGMGFLAGAGMSVIYNEITDFHSHVVCGLMTGAYSVVIGILIAIADLQRRQGA